MVARQDQTRPTAFLGGIGGEHRVGAQGRFRLPPACFRRLPAPPGRGRDVNGDGSERGYRRVSGIAARRPFSVKRLPVPTHVASTSAMGIHMNLRDALVAYLNIGPQHVVGLLKQ